MAFTIQQIDAKIASAELDVLAAQDKLSYWKSVRDVISNPLFAELSSDSDPAPVKGAAPTSITQYPIESGLPVPVRKYGEIKRLVLEWLPESGRAVTPQELAERIAATGFVFQTKTPAISINDTLQTLQKEGKAEFKGKSSSNAGLWLKIPMAPSWSGSFIANEEEVSSEEKTS